MPIGVSSRFILSPRLLAVIGQERHEAANVQWWRGESACLSPWTLVGHFQRLFAGRGTSRYRTLRIPLQHQAGAE
jgi:hypothetical protein